MRFFLSVFPLLFLSVFLFFLSPFPFSTAQSSSDSSICAPGAYYSSVQQKCLFCPVGSFQSHPGAIDCTLCFRDMFSATEGAKECNLCPEGSYAPQRGAKQCIVCPAGHYIDPAMALQRLSLCLPCPPGQWSVAGSSYCVNCPAGSYTDIDGATKCFPCPPNTYSSMEGSSSCTPCATGLTASEGSALCTTPVAPNSNNNGQGSVGDGSNEATGPSSSSLSTTKIIIIAAGSVGGVLLVLLMGVLIYRHRNKRDLEKNRLMIEQQKRSSLNRSSFSQAIPQPQREENDTVGV